MFPPQVLAELASASEGHHARVLEGVANSQFPLKNQALKSQPSVKRTPSWNLAWQVLAELESASEGHPEGATLAQFEAALARLHSHLDSKEVLSRDCLICGRDCLIC